MKHITLGTVAFCIGFFTTSVTYAAGKFVSLSPGLPFLGNVFENGLPSLINTLIGLSVAVAAILAVVMVAVGGFKYMTTDSMFAMGNAKEQITNALVGLLIVLTAILILKTINPNLGTMNIFSPASPPTETP